MTLLNYAPNYFNRVRLQYRHASLDHSLIFRLSETNFESLKTGTFNGFEQFSAFVQSLVTPYGFDDFALLSLSTCDVASTDFIECDIPVSLEVTPGVKSSTGAYTVLKCGYIRIEGSSSTQEGLCKNHLTLNGLSIDNAIGNDFRLMPVEVPAIMATLDQLNIQGVFYSANGVSTRWKRYLNTGISRSLQKRFRG
jgi:hypothetical protein